MGSSNDSSHWTADRSLSLPAPQGGNFRSCRGTAGLLLRASSDRRQCEPRDHRWAAYSYLHSSRSFRSAFRGERIIAVAIAVADTAIWAVDHDFDARAHGLFAGLFKSRFLSRMKRACSRGAFGLGLPPTFWMGRYVNVLLGHCLKPPCRASREESWIANATHKYRDHYTSS